jgi:hypothetical protein
MNKLKAITWFLAAIFSFCLAAEDHKVAIIEPTGGRNVRNQISLVRNQFVEVITKTRGFQLMDRARTDQILKEHNFQRATGLLSSNEARELGKMLGVDLIFTSELTMLEYELEISCQVLDIVTGRVVASGSQVIEEMRTKQIREASQELMEELLKGINKSLPGGLQRGQLSAVGGNTAITRFPGLDIEIRSAFMDNASNAKWNNNKANYMLEVDLSNVILSENRESGFSVFRVTGTIHFTLSDTKANADASASLPVEEFSEMSMDLIRNRIKSQVQPKVPTLIRTLLSKLD